MAQEEKYLDPIEESPPATETKEKPAAEAQEPAQRAEPEARTEERAVDPANSPARPEGYVPKQALEEARGETRREREARERAEANFQKFLDRFYDNQATPQQPDEPDLGPDPEDDPVGATKWMREQRRQELISRQQASQQMSERQLADRAWHEAVSAAAADFQQASVADPTVKASYEALLGSFKGELEALGLQGPALQQEMNRIEAQYIQYAHQNRIPISTLVKNLAKARGFSVAPPPKPAAEQQAETRRDPATGQFVSPEAERSARIAQSQERNGSLSQAPGAPVKKLTAAELGKMSEEEMWATFGKNRRNKDFDREFFKP